MVSSPKKFISDIQYVKNIYIVYLVVLIQYYHLVYTNISLYHVLYPADPRFLDKHDALRQVRSFNRQVNIMPSMSVSDL